MDIDVTAIPDLSTADRQELSQLNLRVYCPREARDDPVSRLVFGGYDDTMYVVRVRPESLLVSCLLLTERRDSGYSQRLQCSSSR